MKTPEELGITRQQFNNLFKRAHYLLKGKLKAAFDMGTYSDLSHDIYTHTCGSVGCVIGHLPFALNTPKPKKEAWTTFAKRKTGFSDMDSGDYMFSLLWRRSDNTPKGAGQRILYVLKYGIPAIYNTANPSQYSGMRLVRKSHSKRKSK